MTTTSRSQAAKQNIKKAQEKWQSMSTRQRSQAQPEGRARKKPGATGSGNYFRIVVRPKEQFTSFRTQDVGEPGGIQRVAGRRKSGSWDTQVWLVSKDHAHVSDGDLEPDSQDAKDLFESLDSKPVHQKGDIYSAKSRRNVPEKDKPTRSSKASQKK